MQTLVAWSGSARFDAASALARVDAWYAAVDPTRADRCHIDSRPERGLALWSDAHQASTWPQWWEGRGGDGTMHSVATLYAPLGFESVTGGVSIADAPGELGWRLIEDPRRIGRLAVPLVIAQIHDGDLHIVNDILGVGRLFECRAGDVTVWSNRPVAALLFAGLRAQPDRQAWRYQAAVDWCMGDTSPYGGVTCVPAASHVAANHNGVSVSTHSILDGLDPTPFGDTLPQTTIDEVADALTASARSVAALWPSQVPMIGLSGGRDSRLVAAAFIAAGVDVTCRTNDTIAGEGEAASALIAALPESRRPRHEKFQSASGAPIDIVLSPDDGLARADRWHDLTEGLRSPVYLSANPPKGLPGAGRPILNGSAGEIARGNYYPPDLARVEAMREERRWSEYSSVLTARVCLPHGISALSRNDAARQIDCVLAEARGHGIDDARALDWFYVRERVRRWGTYPESTVTITPLLTPDFVRIALRVPPHLRPTGELHRRVTETLVPEWTGIAYFDANLKTRTKARRRRVWQEPDADRITAVLDSGESDAFDMDAVRGVWNRARGAHSAGERDDLLLSRFIWNHTFEDHCRRVNGLTNRERPSAIVVGVAGDTLAGARRAATRLNDVPWAKRFARTRLGRRIRRILGV